MNRLLQHLTSRPIVYRYREWSIVSHGAFLSVGFGLGILYWLCLIAYRFAHSLPPLALILGMVLVAYAGSRLLFMLERALAIWLKQTAVYTGGHRVAGGILASLLYYSYYFYTSPAHLLFYADCMAPAIALGYAFGKLGCLSYGCCVGCPTRARLAVQYTADISKAVGYYALKGIPLSPLQLYEALIGIGVWVLLSLQPAFTFGTGQVVGGFLLCLGLGRLILLRLRYRLPDERAIVLVAVGLDVFFVLLGLLLLSKGVFSLLSPLVYEPAPTGPVPFFWPLLIAAAGAALALYLFGVHRLETDRV